MVTPDILHNVHGFFCHHIMQWVFNLVDKVDFNLHVVAMPHMVSLRAYKNGLSKFKQWTGEMPERFKDTSLALFRVLQRSNPR